MTKSMTLKTPRKIFVFSGKRKSGKDFIAEKLQKLIGVESCALIHLSAPLKYQYAKENGLDYNLLLTSGPYKEKYRQDMIQWGEEKRNLNPNYFCKAACSMFYDKHVWIVVDARRPSDIAYFKSLKCNVILVRISAGEEVRKSRGWKFVKGVDDCMSECALDEGIQWDLEIVNEDNEHLSYVPKLAVIGDS